MSVRVNLGRGGGAEAAVVRFSRSDGVCRQCRPGMGGPAWGLGGGDSSVGRASPLNGD